MDSFLSSIESRSKGPFQFYGVDEKVCDPISYVRTLAPDGVWSKEPDNMRWSCRGTGFSFEINRTEIGVLCGYVFVPVEIPSVDTGSLNVHGGCNYREPCPTGENTVYGFDCAHAFDLVPMSTVAKSLMGLPPVLNRKECPDVVYRDVDFVVDEVVSLALQIWESRNDDTGRSGLQQRKDADCV